MNLYDVATLIGHVVTTHHKGYLLSETRIFHGEHRLHMVFYSHGSGRSLQLNMEANPALSKFVLRVWIGSGPAHSGPDYGWTVNIWEASQKLTELRLS